jgi:hypothetical protein
MQDKSLLLPVSRFHWWARLNCEEVRTSNVKSVKFALMAASPGGHEKMTAILGEKGADANARGGEDGIFMVEPVPLFKP